MLPSPPARSAPTLRTRVLCGPGRRAASCFRRHPRHDPASIGFVDDAAGRVACVDRVQYVIRETRTEPGFSIGELTHVANAEIDAGHSGMSQWKSQRHLRE